MAFVALSASTLSRPGVDPAGNICNIPSAKRQFAPAWKSVRMAFSSIDMPEKASVLFDDSLEVKENMLNAAYKHVFGNAYLMEEERAELAKAESDFKNNTMSAKDFVRTLGKSEAYRKRFFSRTGPYRFVELNFKHFLGRGPNNQEEISYHVQKLINEGYDAEIDSYLDSGEYDDRFGELGMPRFVFQGEYLRNDDFNRMTIMRKHWDGCSTSTVSGSTAPGKPIPAQLTMGRDGYVNGFVGVMKGLPAGFRPIAVTKKLAPVPLNANAGLKVRIQVAENLFQVFEVPAKITKDVEPEWKKELQGPRRWNGVWY